MDPYVQNTIPGLSGLPDAQAVGDDYTLKPFEYFRNEGGQRYVQNALSSGQPGAMEPAAPVGSVGSMLGPGIGAPDVFPSQGGIGQMQGQPDMMASIMPLLMMLMKPGVGGFGGIGAPSRIQGAGGPAPYTPQPTGGISRGSFSF